MTESRTTVLSTDVSILGLGMMGAKFAETYLGSGRSVAVWNRSDSRIDQLTSAGASVAKTPAAAINASPLVIVCVDTSETVMNMLSSLSSEDIRPGQVLVNLTTATSDEADEIARLAEMLGLDYLGGQIVVSPSRIGAPDTGLVFAGSQKVWETLGDELKVLGPKSTYLGSDVRLIGDQLTSSFVFWFTSLLGFVEGLAHAKSTGVPVDFYLQRVEHGLDSLREFFRLGAEQSAASDYPVCLASIETHFKSVEPLPPVLERAGVSSLMIESVVQYLRSGVSRGLGNQEVFALIDTKVARD